MSAPRNFAKAAARDRMRKRGSESINGASRRPVGTTARRLPTDQTAQPCRVPKLPEPVIVAQFWRNRRGEAVVVRLGEFNGHVFADARVNFTNSEGKLQPTTKGVSVPVRRLPELAAAFAKAEAKARELGLLEDRSEP